MTWRSQNLAVFQKPRITWLRDLTHTVNSDAMSYVVTGEVLAVFSSILSGLNDYVIFTNIKIKYYSATNIFSIRCERVNGTLKFVT